MSKASRLALVFTVVVAGCGAPAQPETPAADPETKPAAPDDSPERKEFMAQCAHSEDQQAFCSCSYDQAKQVLTPEEMGKSDLAPDRAAALRRAIGSQCPDKLPEQAVKDGFMARCTAQGPSLKGFCDCTWETLRKAMSVKEMAQLHRKDNRVQKSAEACIEHFPESELERSFLEGCVKEPAADKYCRCAWSTLRKNVTTADLALGGMTEDESREAYTKVKNECKKLAPPPPAGAK
jgi:hypothetical protein